MAYLYTRTIDMTPAGDLLPRPVQIGWPARIGVIAALVAVATLAAGVAALFLWIAATLLPIAIVAGLIAWGAFRLQLRRLRA